MREWWYERMGMKPLYKDRESMPVDVHRGYDYLSIWDAQQARTDAESASLRVVEAQAMAQLYKDSFGGG